MAVAPGSPEWWLDRLYKKLRDRQTQTKLWDNLYVGEHPAPLGYEKAGPMLWRLLDTIGLNMLAVVTDAALDRMEIRGFRIGRRDVDDAWDIWQANNFDLGSELVRQEKMALSEAYVMVDPRDGGVRITPEHPDQVIVEYDPTTGERAAALKVWQDELTADGKPVVRAWLQLPGSTTSWAAPTRIWQNGDRSLLALKPTWERQEEGTGANGLGEVSVVPFPNRGRMLRAPVPEFNPAIRTQYRLNKTLLDRMAMQDKGAFKAMWATGLKIPVDPVTQAPVEDFVKAIDRMFVNENPEGKFGQLEAEDIKQILEAARDDVADCAILVPTSPDQIMGKLVNVSGDGLKLAQVSEVKRVKRHIRHESEGWEDVARLTLKAAGKSLDGAERMETNWRNPEYRTDTEAANAAQVAIKAGMPRRVAWERYFGATPEDVNTWLDAADEEANDPVTRAIVAGVERDRATSDDPSIVE